MKTLKQGTIKRLHVNRHVMAANKRYGRNDPALTIQTSRGPIRATAVHIDGPSYFYQAKKPLSCGARAYVQTTARVEYLV